MADIDDIGALLGRVPTPEIDDVRALKTNWLYCLLVHVRDDTPEQIRRNVERCVPVYVKHHGAIVDMTASFQFVAFGVHGQAKTECRERSRAVVNELRATCGEDVRILAFDGDLAYGNIGTDERMNYTVFVPKFDRFLAALLKTEFGGITELGTLL